MLILPDLFYSWKRGSDLLFACLAKIDDIRALQAFSFILGMDEKSLDDSPCGKRVAIHSGNLSLKTEND